MKKELEDLMVDGKLTVRLEEVIDICSLAKNGRDAAFIALVEQAIPWKELRRLEQPNVWLHPIRYVFGRPCRAGKATGCNNSHKKAKEVDDPMSIVSFVLAASVVATAGVAITCIAGLVFRGLCSVPWEGLLMFLVFDWFLLIWHAWGWHSESWDFHEKELEEKHARILRPCFKDYLQKQVHDQRNRLFGETGIFEQIKKLLSIQVTAYGRDLPARKSQTVVDTSKAPFRVSDPPDKTNEELKADSVALPEDLVRCASRLATYFATRETQLLEMCNDSLHMIERLQGAAKTEYVAAKGAEHLEKQFADKVNEILKELERITESTLGTLGSLFQGSDRETLDRDLVLCTSDATTITSRLIETGVPVLESRTRVVPDAVVSSQEQEKEQNTRKLHVVKNK